MGSSKIAGEGVGRGGGSEGKYVCNICNFLLSDWKYDFLCDSYF